MDYKQQLSSQGFKTAKVVFFMAILLVVLFGVVGTVKTGERGIHTRFSAVTGKVFGEGIYFKVPFIEGVTMMNVQVQKEEVIVGAASKDLQTVNAKVALNYHLIPERVSDIYRSVGTGYKERIISPAIQEAMKASTAKFTAEELITKRELVKEEIKTNIKDRLGNSNIFVDDLNIIDFDFSKSFNEAIEAKVTAEQNALAAKNKLEQVKFEAQQAVESAKGKAEAITVEATALKDSSQLIELRKIEKWNGTMPQYVGAGVTPFIDISR
ncbi:MAG: HflC protein [uncultured bacterium]|nr:MAG: HflC protein [uncultured bacterium]